MPATTPASAQHHRMLGAALALCATQALADGPGRAAIASPHPEATAAAREMLEHVSQ